MGDEVVEVPMDEKWKLTKKGSMKCSSSRKGGGEALLRRSDSVPASRNSFSRKCATLVKEQRAKFYIVRRCVTMLVCWKDYRDS